MHGIAVAITRHSLHSVTLTVIPRITPWPLALSPFISLHTRHTVSPFCDSSIAVAQCTEVGSGTVKVNHARVSPASAS